MYGLIVVICTGAVVGLFIGFLAAEAYEEIRTRRRREAELERQRDRVEAARHRAMRYAAQPSWSARVAPPVEIAQNRSRSDDGFLSSMLIAEVTDSPVLGALGGGNVAGALVGSMIAESSHHHDTFSGGGGESAGGGASSSWSDTSSSSSDTSSSGYDSCSSSFDTSSSSCDTGSF